AQGDKPATLLSYNYLPLGMQAVPDPEFFFNNPYVSSHGDVSEDFYSEAKELWNEQKEGPSKDTGGRYIWYGNFFPDMRSWNKLSHTKYRGAGGHQVYIMFPNSSHTTHMSVFPNGTYKKAHRHAPGFFIVIPEGEGFSVMWKEGEEKVFIPWHEASCFVPPDQWFHQHFNVGAAPARYLALHPSHTLSVAERVNIERDQIEYPDEDPLIRQTFEKELAKRGLTSLMAEGAYKDQNYQWEYAEDKG
ncbi:cupin domain-containing protein, partial [Chloroflexota bacterium]